MRSLKKREENYLVNLGDKLVQDAISKFLANEPKKETSVFSHIFSKRVTNNFINMKVYNNCTFYMKDDGGD